MPKPTKDDVELAKRLLKLLRALSVTGHPMTDEQVTERLLNELRAPQGPENDLVGTVRHGPRGETAVRYTESQRYANWAVLVKGDVLGDVEVADWPVGTPVEGSPAANAQAARVALPRQGGVPDCHVPGCVGMLGHAGDHWYERKS